MKITEKDIDNPDHFDNLLGQTPETVPRDASKDELLVYSMPPTLDDLVCVVGEDQAHADQIWHLVKDIKGAAYAQMVIPKSVKDVSKWGAGHWSDSFFFSAAVFNIIDTLEVNDQKFIRAIVIQEPISKALGLDSPRAKKSSQSGKIVLGIILVLSMIMVTILILGGV